MTDDKTIHLTITGQLWHSRHMPRYGDHAPIYAPDRYVFPANDACVSTLKSTVLLMTRTDQYRVIRRQIREQLETLESYRLTNNADHFYAHQCRRNIRRLEQAGGPAVCDVTLSKDDRLNVIRSGIAAYRQLLENSVHQSSFEMFKSRIAILQRALEKLLTS